MSDPDFTDTSVAIVGVGLIGGSLSLAFKRAGIRTRIIGISRRETLDRAIEQARSTKVSSMTTLLRVLQKPI